MEERPEYWFYSLSPNLSVWVYENKHWTKDLPWKKRLRFIAQLISPKSIAAVARKEKDVLCKNCFFSLKTQLGRRSESSLLASEQ